MVPSPEPVKKKFIFKITPLKPNETIPEGPNEIVVEKVKTVPNGPKFKVMLKTPSEADIATSTLGTVPPLKPAEVPPKKKIIITRKTIK